MPSQFSDFLLSAILYFNYFVLSYHIITNIFYLMFIFSSLYITVKGLFFRQQKGYQRIASSPTTPPISILVAAHNEELNIVQNIQALMTLDYPSYEIIVINDGSEDQTLERLNETFGLRPSDLIYRPHISTQAVIGFYTSPTFPSLTIVDKAHGGKGDALNVGINIARSPYFCSIDADSIMEKDALLRLIKPIVENPNPNLIVATGGIVRIINGCRVEDGQIAEVALPKDSLSLLQIVEYLRSFLFGRTGWSALNSLLVISGTFAMFHKKTVQEAGGFDPDSVTEDMELVVRLHKMLRSKHRPYQISFVHDPICWTEAPKTLKVLAKQRRRWHRGLAESLWTHRSMLFNPKYHQIGLISFPYHVFIETLGPFVELTGYFVVLSSYFLGIVDFSFFMLFITLSILFGSFLSTGSIAMEEVTYRRYPHWRDLVMLLFYGVLENFGYRQLNAWWRIQALFQLTRKKRWEFVKKEGFST